jgi:hypothetical protein
MRINKFLPDATTPRDPRRIRSKVMLVGLALTFAGLAGAAFVPLTITSGSYNADAIVESNATPVLKAVTTASVDNGTNNTASTWYEIGYDAANPSFGLPAANSVVVARDNANYSFRMPPSYTANNGILIDTAITNGTFTLTTPTAYTLLSFAGSGGNGGDVIGVRVNHADGTFEVGSFGCPDWFGGTSVIMATQGRMGDNVQHTLQVNGDNPRIYFRDITLTNTTSAVTNIVLSYVSGGAGSHNDILAVSGATTVGGPVAPIAVTGYTYDFVVEATAARRGQLVSQQIVAGTNVWATSQTMDNDANTGFAFYERGYNFNLINNLPFTYGNPAVDAVAQASGIPPHGSTFTNAAGDHIYKMAPDYTTNDVVWVSPTVTNATITLVTPTAATALSFLSAAGNGPVNPVVVVHHQDGSAETNTITIVDWFSGNTPMYIPNGRVDTGSGQYSQVVVTGTGADRLFGSDLPLTYTVSPVTSIDLVYTNTGGRAGIFAVSATAGAVAPIFTQQPASTNTYAGNDISFGAQVIGTAPFTFQWQKGTNGVFVNLSNGGNVSGATTSNLTVTAANYFSDGVDYRIIAANGGGSVTSSVVSANLFSTLTDVTQPGDPISAFGASLFGDGAVAHAVDNDLGTKFGANLTTVGNPIGLVVTPAAGPTVVTAIRFYTANDAPERDPSDYKLEGSINGGSSYTLIASNSMTLPAGRNSAGALDPLVTNVKEVHFSNSTGYSTYRLSFSHLSGGPGQSSFQIGDVELLGVTTNLPVVVSTPTSAKAYQGNPVSIAASVGGSPTPNSRWQKQIGGVFTYLSDSATISGSATPTLTINPAQFGDVGQYRIIATNTSASVTSAVVQVTIYSTNLDITSPADAITDFGNTSGNAANPSGAIDNTFTSFNTRGSGLNNNAGFPPFAGPVGVVVTPAAGLTRVTGLRVYPGSDGTQNDPADVKLEGSNNGGTSYTTLVPSTALSLPDDRNNAAFVVDPLTTAVQEILFANSQSYTSYRLTFNHTKDDNSSSSMSVGEVELLGVAIPVVTISASGGTLTITSSQSGTLLSATNLLSSGTVWTSEGPISGSVTITPAPGVPRKFYRVSVP